MKREIIEMADLGWRVVGGCLVGDGWLERSKREIIEKVNVRMGSGWWVPGCFGVAVCRLAIRFRSSQV